VQATTTSKILTRKMLLGPLACLKMWQFCNGLKKKKLSAKKKKSAQNLVLGFFVLLKSLHSKA